MIFHRPLAFLAVFLFIGVLAFGVSDAGPGEVGGPAPDFTLYDLDGNPYTLSDNLGKAVVLTFWGTNCKAAFEAQMPALQEQIYNLYDRDRVEIFSINITPGADPDQLKACRDEAGITFPILLEGLRASMEYGMFSAPNLVLVDSTGIVRYKAVNTLFDEEADAILKQLVEELPTPVGSRIHTRAIDFTLPQLDGDPVTLSEEVAKYDVVLLYFFYAAT